jgi:hypothetical protein
MAGRTFHSFVCVCVCVCGRRGSIVVGAVDWRNSEAPLLEINSLMRNATGLVPNAHGRITYVKLISFAD